MGATAERWAVGRIAATPEATPIVSAVALTPGLSGNAELEVAEADTAIAARSGDVPVLATPRLIALCEEATLACLVGHVPDGCSTVGVRVQLDHLAPTAVGGRVVAEAHLDKVEGRRLVFNVSAKDDRGLVAATYLGRLIPAPPTCTTRIRSPAGAMMSITSAMRCT